MSETDLENQIRAARAYEKLHVPALFRQWSERVLDAADVRPGDRVLDVACGTGALAREAADRVGDSGGVAGLDPDPGMLAVAGSLAPSVEWRQGTAASLPYGDGSFDVVACQFGLMFFPDPVEALRDMWRVLAPGGTLVVAVWDAVENSPAYPVEVALLERHGGRRAAEALRAPFSLGDPEKLARLLEGAGIHSASIATQVGTARFPSIRVMVEADLRGWLPVMGVELGEDPIRHILEEAESALLPWVTPGGEVAFDSPAHLVTATKR